MATLVMVSAEDITTYLYVLHCHQFMDCLNQHSTNYLISYCQGFFQEERTGAELQ
jgi:hypothetical protein